MVAKSLKKPRRRVLTPRMEDQLLLRLLLVESTGRGESLAQLAAHLGVSYRHVAQWRRNEYHIANASRPVLEAAGRYLKVPTVIVLCLAGIIGLADFSTTDRGSLAERVRFDLERMAQDPYFAGFVPDALAKSDPSIQRLVAFLYRELSSGHGARGRQFDWMRALELAAVGHAQMQSELAALMAEQGKAKGRRPPQNAGK